MSGRRTGRGGPRPPPYATTRPCECWARTRIATTKQKAYTVEVRILSGQNCRSADSAANIRSADSATNKVRRALLVTLEVLTAS